MELPRWWQWSWMYSLVERIERNRIILTLHLTHGEYILIISWETKGLYQPSAMYRRKVGDFMNVDDGTTVQLPSPESPRAPRAAKLMMSEEKVSEYDFCLRRDTRATTKF